MYLYYLFKQNKHITKRKPSQAKYPWSQCWRKQPSRLSTLICLAHLLWCAGLLDLHLGCLLTPDAHHQPPLSWQPITDRLLWLPSPVLSLRHDAMNTLALWAACWSLPAPGQTSEVTRQHALPACRLCPGPRRECLWGCPSYIDVQVGLPMAAFYLWLAQEILAPSSSCFFIGWFVGSFIHSFIQYFWTRETEATDQWD